MALWKYEVHVMPATQDEERKERIWELGRRGWELIAVLPGDYVGGNSTDPDKFTIFLKREATHDINF